MAKSPIGRSLVRGIESQNFSDVICECHLVALELHVQQLEVVAVHGHLLRAADLVVHGVEAPEAVAAAGLITLVVAELHRVGKQDLAPEFNVLKKCSAATRSLLPAGAGKQGELSENC